MMMTIFLWIKLATDDSHSVNTLWNGIAIGGILYVFNLHIYGTVEMEIKLQSNDCSSV